MNDLIVFSEDGLELEVRVNTDNKSVWLNRKQMALLFERDIKTIGKHINNALKEELDGDNSVVAKYATTGADGKIYNVNYYNLDVIISVGYRVKSFKGIAFRRWANRVIFNYLTYGYAINEKRLAALERTVRIESRIIAGVAGIQEEEVFKVIQEYTRSLELLDDYDHQQIKVPAGHIGA